MGKICRINAISWVLIVCVTHCRLTWARNYYELDSCDFGTYNGICLAASKCTELPAIMNELGLNSSHVERCGFTAMEEIICCPTKPKAIKTPKEVPNILTEILKPYEFRSTPDNETFSSSNTRTIAIDDYFFNNFKKNLRNPKSEGVISASNVQSINDQKINIEGVENHTFSGSTNDEYTQKPASVFMPNKATNQNYIEHDWNVRQLNEAETKLLNGIFNVQPEGIVNSYDKNTPNNELFKQNPATNLMATQQNTMEKEKSNNVMFNLNLPHSGNPNLQHPSFSGKPVNEYFQNTKTPIQTGIPIERKTFRDQFTPYDQQNPRFNLNLPHSGNPNTQHTQTIFTQYPVQTGIPVEQHIFENPNGGNAFNAETQNLVQFPKPQPTLNLATSSGCNPNNWNARHINAIQNQDPQLNARPKQPNFLHDYSSFGRDPANRGNENIILNSVMHGNPFIAKKGPIQWQTFSV